MRGNPCLGRSPARPQSRTLSFWIGSPWHAARRISFLSSKSLALLSWAGSCHESKRNERARRRARVKYAESARRRSGTASRHRQTGRKTNTLARPAGRDDKGGSTDTRPSDKWQRGTAYTAGASHERDRSQRTGRSSRLMRLESPIGPFASSAMAQVVHPVGKQ